MTWMSAGGGGGCGKTDSISYKGQNGKHLAWKSIISIMASRQGSGLLSHLSERLQVTYPILHPQYAETGSQGLACRLYHKAKFLLASKPDCTGAKLI